MEYCFMAWGLWPCRHTPVDYGSEFEVQRVGTVISLQPIPVQWPVCQLPLLRELSVLLHFITFNFPDCAGCIVVIITA
jgi:hypothetical protein